MQKLYEGNNKILLKFIKEDLSKHICHVQGWEDSKIYMGDQILKKSKEELGVRFSLPDIKTYYQVVL